MEAATFTGRVGFIGLGNMGNPMATRLLDGGIELEVLDVRPEAMQPFIDAGVEQAGSPAQVATDCDVVLVSLPTPQLVMQVALGPEGLIEGQDLGTYVDLSTTGPDVAKAVAGKLSAAGMDVLDAPVSGGVPGAKVGSLAIMLSGPEAAADRYRPLLEMIGKNIFYISDQPGSAQSMKVLNNLLSATAVAITSEAMALGVKLGLDAQVMLDVFNASSGMNTATRDKFPRSVVDGSFDYGFEMALMCKDLNLCLAQADTNEVPMWVAQTVKQLWNFVHTATEDPVDFTVLAKTIESWAGVEIRSR